MTESPHAPGSDIAGLSNWLLGHGPVPSTALLRSARVAAYAYTTLPAKHPNRRQLRADFVASFDHHQRLKRELQALLGAWRDASIDVLLFKGFHLSEFVYPHPGMRPHGDVNVLLRPEQLDRAEAIAAALGWYSAWPPLAPFRHSHTAFRLRRVDGSARIDIHREIIHAVLPWHSVQRRITAAVWNCSRHCDWAEIDVREPHPVDMLLVGLVLQRCWGSDQWDITPHDVVDFRFLTSRFGITRNALWERARELRCERTLGAFLERCDPDADRLDLSPLSARQRRRLHQRAFAERGLLGAPALRVRRVVAAPFALALALSFVPRVLQVRVALSRHGDIRSLLRSLCAEVTMSRSPMRRETVIAGVRWATRLVGSGAHGECLVRALATFVELRRRGGRVAFVSGVRRDGAAVVGHAWVECEAGVLMETDQPEACAEFEENFRFPGQATEGARRGRLPAVLIPAARAARVLAARTHPDSYDRAARLRFPRVRERPPAS